MPNILKQHVGYPVPGACGSQRTNTIRHDVLESPFTRSKTQAKTAVISIDLGTTATRAELACLEANPTMRVIFPVPAPTDTPYRSRITFGPADFPNQVDAFGKDWSIYLTPEGKNIFFPLKCIAYIEIMRSWHEARRTAKIDEILDQIPQIRRFWRAYVNLGLAERDSVFQRLQILHQTHLETVKKRTDALAVEKGMRVTKLIAMVPGNWDAAMTQRYVDRLLKVWGPGGLSKDDIQIIGECDARAHWLVLQKPLSYWFEKNHRNYLIADFGGHTLNIYRFAIVFNKNNNNFCYFAFGNGYTSHHGGGSAHEALVRDELLSLICNDGRRFDFDQIDTLLDSGMRYYRNELRENIDGSPISITASGGPTHPSIRPIQYDLNPKKCRQFYDRTLGDLLEIFASRIEEASLDRNDVSVLCLGGTFENTHLLSVAKASVAEAELTWDESRDLAVDTYLKPSIGANGGAQGFQSSITATNFIMAVSFGINMPQQEGNELPLIMSKSHVLHLSLHKALNLLIGDTYAVRELTLARGHYLVWLETYLDSNTRPTQDYLVFCFIRQERGPSGDMKPVGDEERLKWPVFYEPGHRLILVDRDLLGEGPTTVHHPVPPPDAKDQPDSSCYTELNPLARGNWGPWEESLNTKREVAARRR